VGALILLSFLPLKVSDKKFRLDGRDKPPNNWLHLVNNLEILLIIKKLDRIIKKLVILLQFLGKNRAVSY